MKISIVDPCRNESKYIAECIDAIFKCELTDNSEFSKAISTSFGLGIGNFRTLNKSGFTDAVTSPTYSYW